MKIKWEESNEIESDLLDILKLENDARRKNIVIKYENSTLDIIFSFDYKMVYIANKYNGDVVFQMVTGSGISEETIVLMTEQIIKEFEEEE